MESLFTETETEFLKKRVKLSGIARRLGLSRVYVSQILRKERNANSENAKRVVNEFKKILEEFDTQT